MIVPIATNFDLKPADREDTEYPVCILDTPQSRVWYKRDSKFNSPKGENCQMQNIPAIMTVKKWSYYYFLFGTIL